MSSELSEPGFGVLLDWLENRLLPEQAADVATRVAAGSEKLQRTVAWLRAYLAAAERVHFASSPALQARLVSLFEAQMRHNRPPSRMRRYVAALTMDTHTGSPLAGLSGMRGRDDDAPRQLLFSTEVVDITLNLKAYNGKTNLNGQIFPNTDVSPDGLTVLLLRSFEEADITTTNETGHFAFGNLAPGKYEIVAIGDEFEIQTTTITF